ncbi:MAG TPA: hypothetical protein VJK52_04670, partial [Candidatus Nanoarchaeia archaeon]|nr:hypothetical protein [Candidatus Nanoarchaeia archaeon]
MQRIPEQYPISGGVQRSYLRSLDRMLQVASAHFAGLSNEYSPETKAFGAANQWDWERLPHHPTTYRTFAQLTDRVRQEYRWFDWIDDAAHPSDNRGFFEELGISAVSGMPWGFSFIELARLKEKVAECREKIPAPDVLVQDLRAALLYDETPIDAVSAKTLAIHRHAMRRNYLEQLEQAQLLHCGAHTFS